MASRSGSDEGKPVAPSPVNMGKFMTQIGLWRGLLFRMARSTAGLSKARQKARLAVEVAPTPSAGADALVSLLTDRDPEMSRRAEAAIRDIVLHGSDVEESAELLAVAIDRYVEHRRVAVAELLVRFRASLSWRALKANPLAPVLLDPGHPIHMVVRGLIRRGALADDVALLWRVMVEPAWAAACREHLTGRLTRDERAALLSASHLALNPRRARLAEAKTLASAFAQAAEQGDVASLARLARESDEPLAASATRGLAMARSSDAAARAARETNIHGLCSHPSRPVAAAAILAAHEDLRAAHRRRTRIGRDATIRELRSELLSADPKTVDRAVDSVRRMRLCRELSTELGRIAVGGHARSAATACAALRGCTDAQSYAALRCAVEAADHRVAATAIESLSLVSVAQGRFESVVPVLLTATEDARHRVRAAAARALVQAGHSHGQAAVLAMLGDSRPGHRMAGLWVIERLLRAGKVEPEVRLAGRILSLDDPAEPTAIRGSAGRCAAMISRQLLPAD